jgi:hypothetical protein
MPNSPDDVGSPIGPGHDRRLDTVLDQIWNKFEEKDSTWNFLIILNVRSRIRQGWMALEFILFVIFLSILTSGCIYVHAGYAPM